MPIPSLPVSTVPALSSEIEAIPVWISWARKQCWPVPGPGFLPAFLNWGIQRGSLNSYCYSMSASVACRSAKVLSLFTWVMKKDQSGKSTGTMKTGQDEDLLLAWRIGCLPPFRRISFRSSPEGAKFCHLKTNFSMEARTCPSNGRKTPS
jgi:hypothetical protein